MPSWQYFLQQITNVDLQELVSRLGLQFPVGTQRSRQLSIVQSYIEKHPNSVSVLFNVMKSSRSLPSTPPVERKETGGPTEVPPSAGSVGLGETTAPVVSLAPMVTVAAVSSTQATTVPTIALKLPIMTTTVSVPHSRSGNLSPWLLGPSLPAPVVAPSQLTGSTAKVLHHFISAAAKAGIIFDGSQPQLVRNFFKSVDRVRTRFQLQDSELLVAFPELLRGRALRFFEARLHSLTDFKSVREKFYQTYLATSFQDSLLETMTARRQAREEPASDFIAAVIVMNMDLKNPFSEGVLTEFIRKRLHPLFLHRIDVAKIFDLSSLEAECRRVQENIDLEKVYKAPSDDMLADAVYNISVPTVAHASSVQATRSPGMRQLTCFNCGRVGVTVKQCGCKKVGQTSAPSAPNSSRDLNQRLDTIQQLLTDLMRTRPPPRRGNF